MDDDDLFAVFEDDTDKSSKAKIPEKNDKEEAKIE